MMRRIWARMTYANVAATLALVFAMGGSAVAASHYLITSKKQISPKVLKELKGANGPSGAAGAAGASGAQGPAGANGTNGTPGAKGDQGPEGIQGPRGEIGNAGGPAAHWNKVVAKAGASITEPATVELEKIGPFTLTGHCYVATTNTVAATYISVSSGPAFVSESNEAEGEELKAGESKTVTFETASSETAAHEGAFSGPSEGLFAAASLNGEHEIDGAANEAVFLKGTKEPACSFSGFVIGG